jgi:hypothetical protein
VHKERKKKEKIINKPKHNVICWIVTFRDLEEGSLT